MDWQWALTISVTAVSLVWAICDYVKQRNCGPCGTGHCECEIQRKKRRAEIVREAAEKAPVRYWRDDDTGVFVEYDGVRSEGGIYPYSTMRQNWGEEDLH